MIQSHISLAASSQPGIRLNATDESGFVDVFEVPRDPLTESRMLRRRHIRILVEICPMTSAYLSFLLSAIFPAALCNARWHSSPIPPNVEKTIGVKVLFSTWITREL